MAKPDTKITVIEAFQVDLLQKLRITRQIRMRNVQRRISQEAAISMVPGMAPAIKPVVEKIRKVDLIAIGASTGGPSAIQAVITRLPRDLRAGVVISQHMPSGFTKAFAERLGRMGQLQSKEAEDGDVIEKGRILVAPGGKNLLVVRREGKVFARVEEKTDDDRYIPSVDKLLKSSAEAFGSKLIAVVLTGMGSDGKEGVIAVKDSGGYIIAESEKTSIVFGMPREAIATRKVDQVVNLEEIPREILKFC